MLTGTVEAGVSSVVITYTDSNGQVVSVAATVAGTTWSYALTNSDWTSIGSATTKKFTATATDAAGNTGSATHAFTVQTAPSGDACTAAPVLDTFNRANGPLGPNWRALTTTPFTQPNSIGVAVHYVFPTGTIALPWLGEVSRTALFTGIAVAVLTWAVIIGGVKSIGRAAESLAPLKVGLYLAGGLVVIISFAGQIPHVLKLVVTEALTMQSGLGFGLFVAMRYGIARGVYANEAGYGTAAVAYGTAKSNDPSQQGMQAVMEVFIVSFVTATISALTILLTGVWNMGPTSTAAVASAFNMAIPGGGGGYIVALCAFLFGYTTLIGWAYYGEQFLEYILGRSVTLPYRWIYCLLIPFGAIAKPTVVWAWGDLMNALQVFPNMIGLVAMSGVVAAYARRKA